MSRKVFWALYWDFIAILPLEILHKLIKEKTKQLYNNNNNSCPGRGGDGVNLVGGFATWKISL